MPQIPSLPTAPSLNGLEYTVITKSGITYKTTLASFPLSNASISALNNKANTSHTHTLSNLTQSGATTGQAAVWNGTTWIPSTISGTGVSDHTLLTNIGTNTHIQIDSHIASTANPHSTTKVHIGLSNVDNTSDINKPVSIAQQTALNLKANIASPTFTGTVSGITKAMVGLSNVDNISDASKPISTLTQAALDLKANLVSTVNAQTGTSYTLLVSDNNKIITFNNAGAITLTVPTGLGVGFSVLILQLGVGEVTFTTSGTTINNRQGFTKTADQFAAATLVSYATNTFISSGDMI